MAQAPQDETATQPDRRLNLGLGAIALLFASWIVGGCSYYLLPPWFANIPIYLMHGAAVALAIRAFMIGPATNRFASVVVFIGVIVANWEGLSRVFDG